MPEYKSLELQYTNFQLDKKSIKSPEITLVLDLDETLMSSSTEDIPSYDHTIFIEDSTTLIKVRFRRKIIDVREL